MGTKIAQPYFARKPVCWAFTAYGHLLLSLLLQSIYIVLYKEHSA